VRATSLRVEQGRYLVVIVIHGRNKEEETHGRQRAEREQALVDLTSGWLVLALAGLAVFVIAFAVWSWDWRRARGLRRIGILFLSQVLLVVAAGAWVNREQSFFASWDELLGTGIQGGTALTVPQNIAPIGSTAFLDERQALQAQLAKAHEKVGAGHGVMVSLTLVGARSAYSLPSRVYLPDAYFDALQSDRVFPVVEFFTGYPGAIDVWTRVMGLNASLDRLISQGAMPPVVAVIPTQNTGAPHWTSEGYFPDDSECVDSVHGAKADTYTALDVPEAAKALLRVATTRDGWGTLGYSTGGFCAVNLALRHSDKFSAAVSIAGNLHAITDAQTGNLYTGHPEVKRANDPLTTIGERRAWPLSFYLYAGGKDPDAVVDARTFAPRVKAPDTVTTALPASGGHNFTTWKPAISTALTWLARRLAVKTGQAQPRPAPKPTPTSSSRAREEWAATGRTPPRPASPRRPAPRAG
jgi:enterochelin esterase-like enzyme